MTAYWFWDVPLSWAGNLGSGSLLRSIPTLSATAFPSFITRCLPCRCSSCEKYCKTTCFVHCFLTGWIHVKKRNSLSESPVLGCKPACLDRVQQSTLAGSKCPPNVPPGTTAHGFLILLEEHFPGNSYHTTSILHMFAKWSQIWFDISCKITLSSKFGRRKRQELCLT